MISIGIKNSTGDGSEAAVTPGNALLVQQTSENVLEPKGKPSRKRLLSGLLGADDIDTGVTNAIVDGSVTTQYFKIVAKPDYDIMITKLFIFIEDNTVSHSGFGALAALTNGIDIVVVEDGQDTFLVKEGKKFADLISQTFAAAPFGNAATSFELASTTGSEDAQILPFNIAEIIPNGVRIGRGTKDRLELRVKDDLTSVTNFTVRVAGYRHYPPIPYEAER